MLTSLSSPQRCDAWRKWARRTRRLSRKNSSSRSDLIVDDDVDPVVEKFMQVEIRFRPPLDDPHKARASFELQSRKTTLGVYIPPHRVPVKKTTPTTKSGSKKGLADTTTPAAAENESTNHTEETKETEDEWFSTPSEGELMRVSTSMVLDLQQCIWSQIQLERQEHHLPLRPSLNNSNTTRHAQQQQQVEFPSPSIPPAEASTASSSNNSHNSYTTGSSQRRPPSTGSCRRATSMEAPCLVCPATVRVALPITQQAVVYCSSCATLASAELLRKTAAARKNGSFSSLSDLSSSVK